MTSPSALMQDVGHRVRVGDDRHRAVRLRRRSSSHGLARSASDDASESAKTNRPSSRKLILRRDDARILLVCTGSGSSHRRRQEREMARCGRRGRESNRFSASRPSRRVRVVNDRQQRIDDERVAADAGVAIAIAGCDILRNAPTAMRMNVAEAITAADSTLRAGRWLAYRSPSL